MSVHLRREINSLKKGLLGLCSLVEEQVQVAVRALVQRDPEMARSVEERDKEVDRREVEVEEVCLRMLALYQPVAIDLRLIVSVLKINNDLERIGDLAVNIAHKAVALTKGAPPQTSFDLAEMASKSQAMLRDSIRSLIDMDAKLARDVCVRDDEVDRTKRQVRREVEEVIQQDPAQTRALLRLWSVARNLERIADCATNIAEDVIYLVDGEIIRHQEGD